MDKIIFTNSIIEIDLFDKSLYPFYKKQSITSYESIQKSSLQKSSLNKIKELTLKGWQLEEIITSNSAEESVNLLTAVIDSHTQQMMDSGEWILNAVKDKLEFNSTLVDKSGKFVKQLTFENKEITSGINKNRTDINRFLSDLYLQQQMGEIIIQLGNIKKAINRVERGQIDDRIGIYLSAKQQFLESMNIENETIRQGMLINAINGANIARFQLMQYTISNINNITQPNKVTWIDGIVNTVFDINNATKSNQNDLKLTDELLNNIRESMHNIIEATQLCISAYGVLGETKAQIDVLNSYQNFIESAFLQKANDQYTNAEILHSNWDGTDSDWLKFLKELSNMANCKCGKTLLDGEKECARCSSKYKESTVKTVGVVGALVVGVVGAVKLYNDYKKKK